MTGHLILDNELLFGDVVRLLGAGKRVTIPVKGSSMHPLIRGERDLVVLEPVSATDPGTPAKALDIVLFRYQNRFILHRLQRWEGDSALIMGDGVLYNQERCTAADIYGRVCTILKDGVKKGEAARAYDPRSPRALALARLWIRLKPLRRILLAVWRRLPWN